MADGADARYCVSAGVGTLLLVNLVGAGVLALLLAVIGADPRATAGVRPDAVLVGAVGLSLAGVDYIN